MVRLKIGDVFELETSKGLAFFQYVNRDETIGSLIRILPSLHEDIQSEIINEIVKQKELYLIHFPLGPALSRGIVRKVGSYSIPNEFVLPQKFRSEHIINGEFICWHIVDYETWNRERVETLTHEQKQLSPWGTWNDTLLIERIEEEWTLEKWI